MPKSGKKPASERREILSPPPFSRQQQPKSQDKVRVQPTHGHLHKEAFVSIPIAPNSTPGLPPEVLASATKGKSRRKSVELPPKGVRQGSGVREKHPTRGNQRAQGSGIADRETRERVDKLRSSVPRMVLPPTQFAQTLTPPSLPQLAKKRSDHRKRSRLSATPLLYGLRLLILGVGIGAIVGTLLAVLAPASRITAEGYQNQGRWGAQ